MNPKVAVVILNWNGRKFLEQFIPSLLRTEYSNWQLIVADNNSTDDSVAFLQSTYPQIRIIKNAENHGFAGGYNEALKHVKAEYYVLLNSDVEVTKNWIQPMADLLDNDHSIAACQPKLLSYEQRDLFEYAGGAGGWLDKYGYPFTKGRVFDTCEKDIGQYDQSEPVFWASGAALFIRAKVFHEVGGFDEYFFAHQEEIDLCWRIQLAGYKIYSCPASIVYHVGGGTLPHDNSRKTFLNFRNNRIMLSKNLPFPRNIWIMIWRNFLDAVSAWKGLLSGQPGYFVAIARAQMAFAKWWLLYRRKSVFPKSKKGKLLGYFDGNVVWLYFARGIRTFSQIVRKNQ